MRLLYQSQDLPLEVLLTLRKATTPSPRKASGKRLCDGNRRVPFQFQATRPGSWNRSGGTRESPCTGSVKSRPKAIGVWTGGKGGRRAGRV